MWLSVEFASDLISVFHVTGYVYSSERHMVAKHLLFLVIAKCNTDKIGV